MMNCIRSLLFVPGISEKMLAKAKTLGCGMVIFDLEDSVGQGDKDLALSLVRGALGQRRDYPMQAAVRVNADNFEKEVESLAGYQFEAYMLPGAELSNTKLFLETLQKHGAKQSVILLIESALGLIECYETLNLSPSICGAMLGAEDLAADMGLKRTAEGAEIAYARSTVAVACAALRKLPVDTPQTAIGDEAALIADIAAAKALGMKAKAAIHPAQIGAIEREFLPGEEEVKAAGELIRLYNENNGGAFKYNGKMIDAPVIKHAYGILELSGSGPGGKL